MRSTSIAHSAAIFLTALFIVMLSPAAGGGAAYAQNASRKAVFIPQWHPQSQFAGYYMAYEIGIYKKYGIDLEILDGGPSSPAAKALEEKKADFVTLQLSAAIERRAKGVKLINIAQISQRSAILIVAKKKSGIKEVKDLNGKRIGFWRTDFDGILRTFLHKHDLKVQTVPINYTVNLFLLDGIDAMVTMWYNEYYKIINSGINEDELVKFLFFEHDLNLPEDGIYCLEETYNRDPALCRDFVKASIEGWIYAFANEEQAVEAVLKYMNRAHVTANKPHQRWMLARMCDIISPQNSKSSIGDLLETDYQRVASILYEFKVIDSIPEFKTFFINQAANDAKK